MDILLPTDLTDRVLARDGLVVIPYFNDLHLVTSVFEVEGPINKVFIALHFLLIEQVYLRILRMIEDRCIWARLPHRDQQVTRGHLSGRKCTSGTHGLGEEGAFAAAQTKLRGLLGRGVGTALRSPTGYRQHLTCLSLSEYRMVKLPQS